MTIRTTFLQFQQIGGTVIMTMNCTSWVERAVWQGGLERTFNGTLLNTLRNPKREWDATVEFPDFQTANTFILLTASATLNNYIGGLRPLAMLATGDYGALRRAGVSWTVIVQINQMTPWESYVPGAPGPFFNVETQTLGWTADLTIREV